MNRLLLGKGNLLSKFTKMGYMYNPIRNIQGSIQVQIEHLLLLAI